MMRLMQFLPATVRHYCCPPILRACSSSVSVVQEQTNTFKPSPDDHVTVDDQRLLKAAILGQPNVGKSTLVNQLIGQNIAAVSAKVHTTTHKALGVLTEGCHQVILLDTPGVISYKYGRKLGVSRAFARDPQRSVAEADMILVMVDVSDKWTRMKLHPSIVRILRSCIANIPIVLVLNKVDLLNPKHLLLHITHTLMDTQLSTDSTSRLNFREVFMISALSGDGIDKLKEYLLSSTKPGSWEYKSHQSTDQSPEDLLEQIIREKLFHYLDQEIPYIIKQTPVIWEQDEDKLVVLKNLTCLKQSQKSIVIGPGGKTIQAITEEAKAHLESLLGKTVDLQLHVNCKN